MIWIGIDSYHNQMTSLSCKCRGQTNNAQSPCCYPEYYLELVDANAFPEMNALTPAYSLNSGTDMQAI